METRYLVYDTGGSTNIKRVLTINKTVGEETEGFSGHPQFRYVWGQCSTTSLLIGVKKGVVRYKYPRSDGTPYYLNKPSNDLISLTALWICELVPSGVLADKIDDEYGQLHSEVTTFLRRYEQLRQEQQQKAAEEL